MPSPTWSNLSVLSNFAPIFINLAFYFLFALVVSLLMYSFLKEIPSEHRKQEPSMVFLLFIPCFNLIWNFFVFPKTAESFKSYFESRGVTDVGDCGYQLARIFCIVQCCTIIPCLGIFAWLAALVLATVLLVKFNQLKNRLLETN
jgi:hypothetical protein